MSFEESFIERCQHDKKNPYVMISRSLIRDNRISPSCRWLLIYLLSNSDGWKIKMKQIISHCKGFIGRDSVYGLVNEAIKFGYMFKEEGFGKVTYFIKEFPEEPKSLSLYQLPENQDTGSQDTGSQDAKERTSPKKEHIKESAKAHSPDKCETHKSRPPSISFSFEINRFENIETKDIESWKGLYPSVDVDRELKAMTEWIMSNPRKSQKKKQWRKFINSWLSKTNDTNVNREAARSRNTYSNEIDRRPRDENGNVKPSQYSGVFQ